MLHMCKSFLRDTDGAVSVDFVVLTAGIVVVAMVILDGLGVGPSTLSGRTSETLDEARQHIFSDDFMTLQR